MVSVLNSKPAKARFAPKAKPDPNRRTPEWRLQAEIISAFHKLESQGWPFTCAGDMNAEKRTPAQRSKAKVTGMTAGEPDIRVYLDGGRLGLIELKPDDGVLSDDQENRHERLNELGHNVTTLWVKDKVDAVAGAVAILRKMIGGKYSNQT